MDLNAVFLLTKIIEQGSFSQASKITGVSTSSLSRKIAKLESTLGIQLLERTTRKLRLTEQGRIFYEQTQPAMYSLLLAQQSLIDSQNNISGTLRLSIPPGLEESIIIPLLAEFKKKNPDVKIKVLTTDRQLRFVEDGIDVAFRLGKLVDSNHIAHTLIEYEHILVATPNYLELADSIQHPSDLDNHKLICASNWMEDSHWILKKEGLSHQVNINESISINHYASIKLAILKHMGIAELPLVNCLNELKNEQLIQILPDWQLNIYGRDKLRLSIVYTSNRYNSIIIKNFKEFCLSYFKVFFK